MLALRKKEKCFNGLAIENIAEPELKEDGDILVKVQAAGICGGDLHVYDWTYEYQQRLKNSVPVVLGHEFTGEVIATLGDSKGLKKGDRITCYPGRYCRSCYYCDRGLENLCSHRPQIGYIYDGAFAEYVKVPAHNCFKIPDELSVDLGALVEPSAVAFNAVDIAKGILGCNIAVLGPGPIGFLTSIFCRIGGAGNIYVTGISKDQFRLDVIKKSGVAEVVNIDEVDPIEHILDKTNGMGADVVFDTTANEAGMEQALQIVKRQGTVVVLGIYDKFLPVMMNRIVKQEKKLAGSYGSNNEGWEKTIQIMKNNQSHFEHVITDRYPLAEGLEAIEKARSKEAMKILLKP